MGFNNVNVHVSGPKKDYTSTYKTYILRGNMDFASQVTESNMKYVIKYDFDLDGGTVTIPKGCLLEFDGGSVSNGTIEFDNTILIYNQQEEDVLKNITIVGDYEVSAGGKGDKKDNINGMGKIYLKKNKSFAEQLTQDNTIYVIQYDFTLDEDITIPAGCTLQFEGGSISGDYTITGNKTRIVADVVKIFSTDVVLDGTWDVVDAHPEWYGAKADNSHDDSAAIAATLQNFSNIKFQPKTYRMEDVVNIPSNKNIDFNYCTIYWNGTGADSLYKGIFKTTMTKTGVKTTATSGIERGDNSIAVSNSGLFTKNDVVYIDSSNKTDKPYIYLNKVAKIVKIEEDILYLDTTFAFDCPLNSGINIEKITPNENIVIKNGIFTSKDQLSRNDGISGIILNGAINCTVENCSFEKLWFHGITVNMSFDVSLKGIIIKNTPDNAGGASGGGGDAYGVQFVYSNNCNADSLKGYCLRHLVDCTCATNILIRNAEDYKSIDASYNHHSAYEDGITYENCKSYNSASYGFAMGSDPSKSFARTSYNITLTGCEVQGSNSYALIYANEGYGMTVSDSKFATNGVYSAVFGNNGCYFDNCEFDNGVQVTKADYINDEHKSVVNNSTIISSNRVVQLVSNQTIEINNSYIEGRIFLMDASQLNLSNVRFKCIANEPPFTFYEVDNTQKIIIKDSYIDWTALTIQFALVGYSVEITGTTIYMGGTFEVPVNFQSLYTELKDNKMYGRFLTAGNTERVVMERNYIENPTTFALRFFGTSNLYRIINNTIIGDTSHLSGVSVIDDGETSVAITTFIFKDNVIRGRFEKGRLSISNSFFKNNVFQGSLKSASTLPDASTKVIVEENLWETDN